jgi:hypothetical protein
MDFGTIVLSLLVVGAVAAFANWYFKQGDMDDSDDENDIDQQEMNLGLDDRIRNMIHAEREIDDDPYGENTSYPSYRATLVNRGKEDQK